MGKTRINRVWHSGKQKIDLEIVETIKSWL